MDQETSKVFVVTCSVEGCAECGNDFAVVGVFDKVTDAYDCADDHRNNVKHFHYANVNVHTVELNQIKGRERCQGW